MNEGYDKEAEILPPVSEEVRREISSQAEMDAELYLADLHKENPEEEVRDPRENEVLAHISKYNGERDTIMTEQEMDVYEQAFTTRFAQGYKEIKVN